MFMRLCLLQTMHGTSTYSERDTRSQLVRANAVRGVRPGTLNFTIARDRFGFAHKGSSCTMAPISGEVRIQTPTTITNHWSNPPSGTKNIPQPLTTPPRPFHNTQHRHENANPQRPRRSCRAVPRSRQCRGRRAESPPCQQCSCRRESKANIEKVCESEAGDSDSCPR